jgi:hypothetical protein
VRLRLALPTLLLARHRAVLCALALIAAGLISACGGSSSSASSTSGNGVASKSADQILAASTGAVQNIKTVHVSGSVVSGGAPISLNLDLVSGQGARGQMSQNGMSFQLVVAGDYIYINAGPAFWRHIGGTAAAQLLQGRWLKAPADRPDFASLSSLTNLHRLLNALLNSHAKLTKGATGTVNGQKVVALTDTTNHGTLYVAATGKAYPVEIVKAGASGGRITFGRYNETVTLTAPANAIDISKLKSK